MPKLQIIAAMYVMYECVCECVCYGAYAQCPQTQKVTMTIIGEGSNVSNSTKKNLIIIWVWGFLWGRFANESFLVVGWLVAFFRNSVRFSMGYSKDLCVLKESVWKWKWFAINKLKYQRDDNSNNSSRRIII